MPVIAYNKKGVKKIFSDHQWSLLSSEDKKNWQEKQPAKINNLLEKRLTRPDMGQAKQVISNTVGKEEKKPEPINNTPQSFTEEEKTEIETAKIAKEKADFEKAVADISKTQIKDFFDQQDPPVAYDKKAKPAQLQDQLGNYLNYSIEKLQEAFGL